MVKRNPWLDIPAADYDGHMGDEGAGQSAVLGDLIREIYVDCWPRSLAVLGCATGNGFEHFDPTLSKRIVGVDINPDYLAQAGRSHEYLGDTLDLQHASLAYHADAQTGIDGDGLPAPWSPAETDFDLICANLIFEYTPVAPLLERVAGWLTPGGLCLSVLQLPSAEGGMLSPTGYASMESLQGCVRLVDPDSFADLTRGTGLVVKRRFEVPLRFGKSFDVSWLARPSSRPDIISATSAEHFALAGLLFREYAEFLGFDLDFQDFEGELSGLDRHYAAPDGALFLALGEDGAAGCIALHQLQDDSTDGERVCELKRMYLRPAYRGLGLGRLLMDRALAAARELGYTRMRLDTVGKLKTAIGIYRDYGFREIAAYRHNPHPDALYMELEL